MGIIKTATRTRQNPGPWLRVRVLMGTGAGCSGKPQGSLSRSLEADDTEDPSKDSELISWGESDIEENLGEPACIEEEW